MEPTPSDAIQSLARRGLIQSGHVEKALSDPRLNELKVAANESNALVWLVARDVMSEDEFADMAGNLRMTKVGAEYRECQRVVDEAKEGLNALRLHINQETLDALLSANVIDQAAHGQLSSQLPFDRALGSPAALLAWMSLSNLISAEQMQALRGRVQSQAAFATGSSAAGILADAEGIVAQSRKLMRRAAISAVWRGVFPGPPFAWVGVFLALLGWAVWFVVTPTTPPTCGSDSTGATVSAMLFHARVKARTDVLNSGRSLPAEFPHLSDVREVGYARAERSRGCLASVSVGELRIPFAFTIGPATAEEVRRSGDDESRRGEFIVAGADARIVQARYGHIDEQGRFAQQALPIGRVKLEKAFRDGVDAMHQSGSDDGTSASLQQLRSRYPWMAKKVGEETRRTREIAEIEPLSPCREVAPMRHICHLMIERNDPLLEAMGASESIVFEGDFTFERDEAVDRWHTQAESFPGEFRRALTTGRVEGVAGSTPGLPDPASVP